MEYQLLLPWKILFCINKLISNRVRQIKQQEQLSPAQHTHKLNTLIRHIFLKGKKKNTQSYNRLSTAPDRNLRWSHASRAVKQQTANELLEQLHLHLLILWLCIYCQKVWAQRGWKKCDNTLCWQSDCFWQRSWVQCLARCCFDCKVVNITQHEFPELACLISYKEAFYPLSSYGSELPPA